MKRVAVSLKQAGVPFALAGGFAGYARGGPVPGHDVDFNLLETDVARAQQALDEAGLRIADAPEDWLVKVYDGEAMVDLIFAPKAGPVDQPLLDRATELEVDSVRMPVLSATDLLLDKLLALDERCCDFSRLFPLVRSLREQIDWAVVRKATADNPFAAAFLALAATLELID
jgi:hypothetical protein